MSGSLLDEARHLLALNEPGHGGSYQGYAAERFVAVMGALLDRVGRAEADADRLSNWLRHRLGTPDPSGRAECGRPWPTHAAGCRCGSCNALCLHEEAVAAREAGPPMLV